MQKDYRVTPRKRLSELMALHCEKHGLEPDDVEFRTSNGVVFTVMPEHTCRDLVLVKSARRQPFMFVYQSANGKCLWSFRNPSSPEGVEG